MAYSVDVDEADVAVLNQNLTKSRELFDHIQKLLHIILARLANLATSIKPILLSVNRLNLQKQQILEGLALLQDVSEAALQIHGYEQTLLNSVEYTGLRQYLAAVDEAKQLLVELKPKLKRFTNVLILFETLIDKANIKVQTYFQSVMKAEASTLIGDNAKMNEAKTVLAYFGEQQGSQMAQLFVPGRRDMLVAKARLWAKLCRPVERPANIPYERGSNGINQFNNELIKTIKDEAQMFKLLGLPQDQLRQAVTSVINEVYVGSVMREYYQFFDLPQLLVTNDLLALEIIDNTLHFDKFVENYGLDSVEFGTSVSGFVKKVLPLFREYFRVIESKFAAAGPLTDVNIPQLCVELVLKLRRVLETPDALLAMIVHYKLGDWLVLTPPARFVLVYLSLIPNLGDEALPQFLLSLLFSDIIDAIMINIEMGVKQNDIGFKKLTQGFLLVKNLVMVETIINKLPTLYQCLGLIGMERVNKLKNRFLKLFLDDWNYALYIIIRDMTLIATLLAHQGGLKLGLTLTLVAATNLTLKEKDQVKELFRTFNELFEDALRNYEKHPISDQNLRSYLALEIKKLITLAYFKLYDKYGNSDFTKNKAKYVKYNKQQFEQVLNQRL